MTATRTLTEIRAALAIERAYLDQIGFDGGVVPVEEITSRAGFFASNQERSRVEVADFRTHRPQRYFAYHNTHETGARTIAVGARLTTWTGSELGTVTEHGEPFIGAFGDRRQNFRAIAINGEIYTATAYLSSGDYVRMRLAKPRSARETARARRYADSIAPEH